MNGVLNLEHCDPRMAELNRLIAGESPSPVGSPRLPRTPRLRGERAPVRRDGRRLTKRQLQCVVLLSQGLRNWEIAVQLHLTEGTVKVYLSRAMAVIGCDTRVGAAKWWFQRHPEQLGIHPE